jgi:alkanesulfonate monooxygenase SsuD/methylene tetrahydromethanopterin reductase-like flavin-dependent oxidoreductase (luciferase family)
MVTGNTFRHPAVLAKMAATVDHIAHGRLDMGIGAGWMPAEHAMYGIPLPAPAERIQRLGEACEVLRRLWTEEVASFAGHYYTLTEARCEPKPVQKPHPPLVLGGGGERRTLRVVAQYANIWNFEVAPTEMFTDTPIERFAHKSAVLDAHCAAIRRDPAEIERSVQLFADPETLGGTRAMLVRFIAAGATHLILMVRPPYPSGVARRLAAEVIEPLLS